MTVRELLNLIDWLRQQGSEDDRIIECLEAVEGKKKIIGVDEGGDQP